MTAELAGLVSGHGLVPGHRYRVTFQDSDLYFEGWFEATFVKLVTYRDSTGRECVGGAEFDTATVQGLGSVGIVEVTS